MSFTPETPDSLKGRTSATNETFLETINEGLRSGYRDFPIGTNNGGAPVVPEDKVALVQAAFSEGWHVTRTKAMGANAVAWDMYEVPVLRFSPKK